MNKLHTWCTGPVPWGTSGITKLLSTATHVLQPCLHWRTFCCLAPSHTRHPAAEKCNWQCTCAHAEDHSLSRDTVATRSACSFWLAHQGSFIDNGTHPLLYVFPALCCRVAHSDCVLDSSRGRLAQCGLRAQPGSSPHASWLGTDWCTAAAPGSPAATAQP